MKRHRSLDNENPEVPEAFRDFIEGLDLHTPLSDKNGVYEKGLEATLEKARTEEEIHSLAWALAHLSIQGGIIDKKPVKKGRYIYTSVIFNTGEGIVYSGVEGEKELKVVLSIAQNEKGEIVGVGTTLLDRLGNKKAWFGSTKNREKTREEGDQEKLEQALREVKERLEQDLKGNEGETN